MGADHPKSPTELEQYLTLLQQRDDRGQPFVIVGGHAVNFWAKLFLEREPRLREFVPFTSKDLDIIGTKADATRVARAIGWHVLPLPIGGGPIQALLSPQPDGGGLMVEFLSEILGVSHQTIVENVREGVIRIPGTTEPLTIRVLDPVLLLAGKFRNAVDIEQKRPTNPRQDVKHVAMLSLCVPHFLEDVRAQVPEPARQLSICGRYVTILAAIKNAYSGRQFEARYPSVVHWDRLIPQSIHQMAFDDETRTSLRLVASQAQSRGIRI